MASIPFPNEPSYFTPDQLDRLLMHCYDHGASDISIQSGETVFAEIEGKQVKMSRRELTLQEVSDLINFIYGSNATAMVFSGSDIDTNYRVKFQKDKIYRYRVNITACNYQGYQGIQVTLRTISSEPPDLAKMNLEPDLYKSLSLPQGILVVSGATGSGKSTLLASMISHLIQREDANLKVLTYESPIEYVYETVKKPSAIVAQTEIPRYLPSFAAGVRNALRRKPGLILVGEARDQETIEAVIDAALTGHPVYTTVHANGVPDTMRRMVSIFPFAERDSRLFDLIESVKVIIWQALVPGVNGKRVALREFLVFTDEVRDKLLKVRPENLVGSLRELVKTYGQSILQDAQNKHAAGLIDDRVLARFEYKKQVIEEIGPKEEN